MLVTIRTEGLEDCAVELSADETLQGLLHKACEEAGGESGDGDGGGVLAPCDAALATADGTPLDDDDCLRAVEDGDVLLLRPSPAAAARATLRRECLRGTEEELSQMVRGQRAGDAGRWAPLFALAGCSFDEGMALRTAAGCGEHETVAALLAAGAPAVPPSRSCFYVQSPLSEAVGSKRRLGCLRSVEHLLQHGALSPSAASDDGPAYQRLLVAAAEQTREELFSERDQQLLETLLDATTPLPAQLSAALDAAAEAGNEDNVRFLVARGADGAAASVYAAAARGHAGVVRALLKEGADPDYKGGRAERRRAGAAKEQREAPILASVAHGHVAVVKALLAAGADPNVHSPERYTPLFLAGWHGWEQIKEMLLAVDARD
eukprot:Rhum_TRINITY_DN14638_c30_g1::Rhum_TRINITY_DN14638_c30_g1_i1::g.105684::m.105684